MEGYTPMLKKLSCLVCALVCCAALLPGCSGRTQEPSGEASAPHEPITMLSPFRNMSAFLDLLHEQYPEIELEILPYSGKNYSAYVQAQLRAGDMPDIYCTTFYSPALEDLSDKLIDLSGYAFTDNYSDARLREVSDGGAIYLLPTYYNCFGITYNKTLLEAHGWTLPNSMQELEALAPEVEAAGCRLALTQTQLPGCGFQYLCSILETSFLNTMDGRIWQHEFLNGSATAAGTPELLEAMQSLEAWRSLGMLSAEGDPVSDENTRLMMAEGNTLFLIGNSNAFTAEETTDEFGLMPFLSEDGTQNTFILQVSRYLGLNRRLQDAGNEQKLADALHVMELLSTVEGMQALNSEYTETALLPLRDYRVSSGSYFSAIENELNSGMTAPFIYSGWENVVVPIGSAMLSYIQDEASLDDLVRTIDESQILISDNSASVLTTVTEQLDTDDCARLIGICFAKASGADLALISENKWYRLPYDLDLNLEGVSGGLYPLPMTEQELTSILPTGWRGNIQTVTLTGARIRELVETGYDRNGDGNTFPYALVTKEGFTLDDDALYTAAVCGVTDEVAEEGNLTDTGILGLTAAEDYFSRFETLGKKDIVWE